METPLHVRATEMWKAVERETNGRLAVQVFPASTLGGETQMLEQLRFGALQFFSLSGLTLSTVVPAAGIEGTPFVFKDARSVYAAFDGKLGAYIRSEIEAKGIHVFAKPMGYGFYQLTNGIRPVRGADDIMGLKIRTGVNKITVDTFKSLGASPTPLSLVEAYTALQTHVVDGQFNPYNLIEAGKYYEVQRYLSDFNIFFAVPWFMANPAAWKALPPDIQAIVDRNAAKYVQLQRADVQRLAEASAAKLVRRGMIRTATDGSFRARLTANGFYARWKNEFGATAWSLLEEYTGKLTG